MVDAEAVEPTGVLHPRLRTAVIVTLLVLAIVVVRNVFVAAHQVLGWAVAAALLAVFISPVVRVLDVALPRVLAVVVSFLVLIGSIVALIWTYSNAVRNEVVRLREEGPELAEQIERRADRIGTLASDIGLADQVAEIADRLGDSVGSSGEALQTAALSAPPYLITLILTIFFLVFGPRLVDPGLDRLPDREGRRLRASLPEATRRAQFYVGAAFVQALVSGLAALAVVTALDAPAPGLFAIVAAAAALLPYLGFIVGWLPLVILGLALAPWYQVALIALLAVGLQAGEALGWRRFVDRRSLHLGPAIPIVVAVIGNAVYGIGGALCATGIAVLVVALADQLAPGDPLPTPVDDET